MSRGTRLGLQITKDSSTATLWCWFQGAVGRGCRGRVFVRLCSPFSGYCYWPLRDRSPALKCGTREAALYIAVGGAISNV